ncbi:MAG: GDP-mannose 4,6-dehydratase, partial [Halobacteriales archaeon]|nr:GDP-mannose 4,6-dehydratase [Halobacteriales archaeon]
MVERVLITGISGFVGSHLLDLLVGKGDVELYGVIRKSSSVGRIRHHQSEIELVTCDLVDERGVTDVVDSIEPDRIYHLAGQSSVSDSWRRSGSLIDNNIVATVNLLEALRRNGGNGVRILIACSSEEYGLVPKNRLPVDETTPLNPVSPYAVTKAAADMFGFQYYKSFDIDVVRTRSFNHTGPRRPATYALSDFAKQIVSIEFGRAADQTIEVGNLSAIRDYSDVRDIVR